jgi:hypothetical protein
VADRGGRRRVISDPLFYAVALPAVLLVGCGL